MVFRTKYIIFSVIIGIALVAALSALLPFFAFAQETGLVPCGRQSDTGVNAICQACHIFVLVNNLLHFVWWRIVTPAAALMVLVGGFFMVLPSMKPAHYERGKKILTSTIVGIIIIFLGWLLIDTVMKYVLGFREEEFGPWNSILCPLQEIPMIALGPPLGGGQPSGGQPPNGGAPPVTPLSCSNCYLTRGDALAALPSGTSVNNGECPTRTAANCTNLAGLRRTTVDALATIINSCSAKLGSCPTTVTGGAELDGHQQSSYSHPTGYKVDLANNANLDFFLTGLIGENVSLTGGVVPKNQILGPIPAPNGSNLFIQQETSPAHWDILVCPAGARGCGR